jgi:hypothetical protein
LATREDLQYLATERSIKILSRLALQTFILS